MVACVLHRRQFARGCGCGCGAPARGAGATTGSQALLYELGYREGANMVVDYLSAEGHPERLGPLAMELVRAKPDVLIAGFGTLAAQAAKAATTTIPVVFTTVGDPLGAGLLASLGRPAGNSPASPIRPGTFRVNGCNSIWIWFLAKPPALPCCSIPTHRSHDWAWRKQSPPPNPCVFVSRCSRRERPTRWRAVSRDAVNARAGGLLVLENRRARRAVPVAGNLRVQGFRAGGRTDVVQA